MNNDNTSRGVYSAWLLYDGKCGFCSRWVPFWGETLRAISIGFVPLQEPWVRERLGVTDAELLQDLRLLLDDGSEIRGANVYRYVMKRVWWAYPFYLLSIAPLLRTLFDTAYQAFARNRYLISKSCGWSPPQE